MNTCVRVRAWASTCVHVQERANYKGLVTNLDPCQHDLEPVKIIE